MGLIVTLLALLPALIWAQIPTIIGIQGVPPTSTAALLTSGGETITIFGTNFGPSAAQLTYTGQLRAYRREYAAQSSRLVPVVEKSLNNA